MLQFFTWVDFDSSVFKNPCCFILCDVLLVPQYFVGPTNSHICVRNFSHNLFISASLGITLAEYIWSSHHRIWSSHGITLAEYTNLLEDNQHVLIERDFSPWYGSTVYRSIMISLDRISNKRLLYIMTLMDIQNIEGELISSVEDVSVPLSELERYSFIRRGDGNWYTMHSLVSVAIQKQIATQNLTKSCVEEILTLISAYRDGRAISSLTEYGNVWAHHVVHIVRICANDCELINSLEEVKNDLIEGSRHKAHYKCAITCLNTYLNSEKVTQKVIFIMSLLDILIVAMVTFIYPCTPTYYANINIFIVAMVTAVYPCLPIYPC